MGIEAAIAAALIRGPNATAPVVGSGPVALQSPAACNNARARLCGSALAHRAGLSAPALWSVPAAAWPRIGAARAGAVAARQNSCSSRITTTLHADAAGGAVKPAAPSARAAGGTTLKTAVLVLTPAARCWPGWDRRAA